MNRLFVKIFLSFWGITIFVALVMYTTSGYFKENIEHPTAWELKIAANGILDRTENLAKEGSISKLHQFVEGIKVIGEIPQKQKLDIYFSDASGEVFSSIPDSDIKSLANRLNLKNKSIEEEAGEIIFLGKALTYNDQLFGKIIIKTPKPPSAVKTAFQKYIWIRLLTALLASGIICFFMAMYVTRPISALRKAAQKLASGDLSSRYELQTHGSDELSQLGQDFNYMAGRLQQTIEEQKQLIRDISHELRSPLGRIQVALALAQKKCGEDISELHRVEKECGRLNEMIAQLLVIPDSEQQLSDCIDLVGLLSEIANDAQLQAEQANKSITINTKFRELLINTSGDLLWHAVDNIMRNALRHCPVNGIVTIKLEVKDNVIAIAIEDEGEGVPDDAIQKIFHPFYRVETARDRNTGGYGLGLSIAQRAIKRHGGHITAENFSGGFRVTILLPALLLTEDRESGQDKLNR